MLSLELGQRVSIDSSGLGLPGGRQMQSFATGTIVDIAPGVITVRLEADGGMLDVTISPGRILGWR